MPTSIVDLVLGVAVFGLLVHRIDCAPVRWATGAIKLAFVADPVTPRECIVEQRGSFQGIEIVSRVNYSQLARVNRSRGLRLEAQPQRRLSAPLTLTFRPTPAFLRALAVREAAGQAQRAA
jgi:hypothetical protein